MELKKQSTSFDGSTLEQLVNSHSKAADNCKLCQEDETAPEKYVQKQSWEKSKSQSHYVF